jgi:hypothetical protein
MPGASWRQWTKRGGKWAPSLRAAAKIGPYFVLGLDVGTTKAFGLHLVWPDFHQQRHPLG